MLSDTEAGRDSTGGNAGNVTLTADRGAALTFEPADAPTTGVPANTATPVGFFDFTVTGLSTTGPAETVAFTFTLPAGVSANGYLKCNAGTCALFEGAVVNGNQVTFSITDNGVGDDDPARGTIRDPGAPALTSNNSNLSVSSGGGAMPGLLTLADLLARFIYYPEDIPAGVVTALLGGPAFLFLLYRQRGRTDGAG